MATDDKTLRRSAHHAVALSPRRVMAASAAGALLVIGQRGTAWLIEGKGGFGLFAPKDNRPGQRGEMSTPPPATAAAR